MKINTTDNLTLNNKYKELLDKDTLKKDDEIICLIKCTKLIFYKAHCIPYWEVFQIKLKEKALNKKEYLFQDVEEYETKNDTDTDIKNIKIIDFKK